MDRVNLTFFYLLGFHLRTLIGCDIIPDDRWKIITTSWQVQSYLTGLLNSIGALHVCRIPGNKLLNSINEVQKWWQDKGLEQVEHDDPSIDTIFEQVLEDAETFDTVLTSELDTLAAYWATQKGIYSTPALISATENIFPPPVLNKLNKKIIDEIRECGRCLAFDNSTASAFHVIRATEIVLHEYYLSVFKLDTKTTKRLESWGAYIKELKKSTSPAVREVVSILQQIKDRHRNLIMHPEVVLNPNEAFILFEIAKTAIITMADRLPENK